MNLLLSLNKTVVLIISIILFITFILFFFLKFYFENDFKLIEAEINISNADITDPKFAINNSSQKILVSAKEGNFLDENTILLRKNVKFKSNNFSIETENVIFNRNKQTAQSKTKSFFKSKNATISSDGFNIDDNGNRIIFFGNSYIVLR